ncbi:MAG TPA: hypothetical protein VGW33_13025 [Terriglobia bacterium]|nr:hypothetical protein [Terriglobia bacterium]
MSESALVFSHLISAQEVVGSYAAFLHERYPGHYPLFQRRRTANPEAASAEARMFSWLRSDGLSPEVAEHPGRGGMDFRCRPPHLPEFMLEVTSLEDEAVAGQSSWRDTGGFFGLITPKLRSTVSGKVDQLKDYSMPRVLAITSSHLGARALFDHLGAQALLISGLTYSMPLGQAGPVTWVTDLKNSVFFKPGEKGAIVACRRSVSALLLVSMWSNPIEIVGLLHPDPVHHLDIRTFPGLPFVRMRQWPVVGRIISTEWTGADPKQVYNSLVEFTDEELDDTR